MKKLLLPILCVLALVDTQAQTVKFSPETPKAGEPLSFVYTPADGKLANLANVKCSALTFVNMKQNRPLDIELTKDGNSFKGNFTPADSTSIAMLVFSADGTKDDNPDGYYTLFYKNNKPTPMSYFWQYQFYNGMGAALAGTKSDKSKAIQALDNVFELDSSMRKTYLTNYLSLQYSANKEKGTAMILKEIGNLNKVTPVAEPTLLQMATAYSLLRRKQSADSVYAIVKTKFPSGTYAYGQQANAIYNEKDPVKKEVQLSTLIAAFKLDPFKKADAAKLSSLYSNIAGAYGLAKYNVKFEEYANRIRDNVTRASLYNTYAWASAEKGENLQFAATISKRSLELLEAAKLDPVPAYYASKEEYIQGLESNYASYADTYAVLLDHLGNHSEALKMQEAAVNKNNFSSPDMNVRYVNFLAKAGEKAKVIKYAERFIQEGQGTAQMKLDLKSAYAGSAPFENYYAALEKVAIEKEKATIMKEMINMPAPKFTLASLNGGNVSLEQLKGKVVIVDYWATWCGPCIASFPGMQMAVNKYKDDPNVVFLFINTWQTEEAREKVVRDYLATTSYTFNVLLDTKNKQDPSKFDVISQYGVDGIPTKFIIDGNGNIRFKKVGFSGSADGIVKELDMMIALAKGSAETSK